MVIFLLTDTFQFRQKYASSVSCDFLWALSHRTVLTIVCHTRCRINRRSTSALSPSAKFYGTTFSETKIRRSCFLGFLRFLLGFFFTRFNNILQSSSKMLNQYLDFSCQGWGRAS